MSIFKKRNREDSYATFRDRLIASAVLFIGMMTTLLIAFLTVPAAALFSNRWTPLIIGGCILIVMIAPTLIALNKRRMNWLMVISVVFNTVGTMLCTAALAFRYMPELNITDVLFPAACACGLTALVLIITLLQPNRWDNHPQLIGSIITFVCMFAALIVWLASHKNEDQTMAIFSGFICLSFTFLFFFTLASAYVLPYREAFLEYLTFASFGYLAVAALIVLFMLLVIGGDCDCDCDGGCCDGGCCDDGCCDAPDNCLKKPAELHKKPRKK